MVENTDRITRSSNRTSVVNYKDDGGVLVDAKKKPKKKMISPTSNKK